MATKAQIISDAQLYIGDISDLSTDDIGRLFDKIYLKICSNRPWEFTKTTAPLIQSTTVPYVSLPADFGFPLANYNYAGESYYGEGAYLLIGANNDPYQIIPFSDRNRYVNANNKAYLDVKNNRLVFTLQPSSANAFTFDYHAFPVPLALTDSPAFPAAFHPVIYHGMVADDFMIQLFDKARSYRDENIGQYNEYFAMLTSWNFSIAPQT